MPVDRDQLAAYLDDLLDIHAVRDLGPNGLQIEGKRSISKIVTGVSSSAELHRKAVELGADAVMVHHGVFWDFLPARLTGYMMARVAPLVRAEVNLFGYHLPLDRHAELGNNAVAARALGLTGLEPFGELHGAMIGFKGRFPEPVSLDELLTRAEGFYEQPPLHQGAGPERIETLGIISGGAQKEIYQAIDAGLDAYITGENSEWVMNLARESRLHYLACGHYATERCGIRALGEHVAERFGVEVEYVEVANPV
jgi:dinuclear metal center YbgI/SA1388 family protein